jgi:nitrogen regulatory protein PII
MNILEVIIKPSVVEDLIEALNIAGIDDLIVTEVTGFGRQKGHTETYRGSEYTVDFLPKVKVDIVLLDHQIEPCIDIIQQATRTGKIGDGKIFISQVQQAIRQACSSSK